jgi:hypothetical protein
MPSWLVVSPTVMRAILYEVQTLLLSQSLGFWASSVVWNSKRLDNITTASVV